MTTKIHAAVDALDTPVRLLLTAGQASGYGQANALIEEFGVDYVVADKGYDSNDFIDMTEASGAKAVIPQRGNRKGQRPYDKDIYKARNLVERFFQKIKNFRRIATRIVFDRLNTGGEKLNAQELRNALYAGRFSKMLIKIASSKDFTEVWGIPLHKDNTDENGLPNAALSRNSLFKNMKDCEIVLRFYAFRDENKINGSIRKILDICAKENSMIFDDILEVWEQDYFSAIALCKVLFDDQVFRLPPNQQGVQVLSRPLSDALMVAAHNFANHKDDIIAAKDCVRRNLAAKLDTDEGYSLIVGRTNTADSVKERITTMTKLFEEAINEH